MVTISSIADPFSPAAEWVAARRSSQILLTIKDVEAMIKAGIVPEDATTELLHGVLFYVDRAAFGCKVDEMVANIRSTAERFVEPPQPVLSGRWRLVRFTRQDAEALVKMGIVPEDASTELLDGMIVLKDRSSIGQDPSMIGQDHRICVERLSDLRVQINASTRHVESQQPLVCAETQVPEPDFMVLRGTLQDFHDLPAATDAFCVVEVADSSYERDAGEKLIGYAHAGVGQYIIINLRNRTAEVYTNPDRTAGSYAPAMIVTEQQALSLCVGEAESFSVALSDLLP